MARTTRERIITAAERLLVSETSIDAVSVRRIAGMARVMSRPSTIISDRASG
jgi:hypothetical protein